MILNQTKSDVLVLFALMFTAVYLGTGQARADTILYDNGPFSGNQSQKFNNSNLTVLDDFQLTSSSVVTGLIWAQHHIDVTNVVYSSTNLTFYNAIPSPGSLIASVTVTATLTLNSNSIGGSTGYTYSVDGLSLNLAPGVYWVGIHNNATGITTWDNTSQGFEGPLSGRYQFDTNGGPSFPGTFWNENGNHDSVFQVVGQTGQAVPEPSSLLSAAMGLAALAGYAGRGRGNRNGKPQRGHSDLETATGPF